MNQNEITAAIAEQEEYLKRIRSCTGMLGRSHQFRPHGTPGPDGTIRGASLVSRCIVCGVTETNDDYHRALAAADGTL